MLLAGVKCLPMRLVLVALLKNVYHVIEQVFIDSNRMDARTFSTRLFVARRQTEMALAQYENFYVCSLSDKSVVLQRPDDASGFAVFL